MANDSMIHVYRTRYTDDPFTHKGVAWYCIIPAESKAERIKTFEFILVQDEINYCSSSFFKDLTKKFSTDTPVRFDVHPNLPHYETYLMNNHRLYILRENLLPQEINQVLVALKGDQ
ncbi:MAG: hypothetical protein KKA62_00750 [Nanoarchaeota archaeon]|nr:hypothetical protein [Nanoarchaeota archaeon]MBU1644127.1 hypothetical protein [Nanoarchaeota archaeon]MBU1976463.1 hypothetical protein [Nanoarchaeota archaeon]